MKIPTSPEGFDPLRYRRLYPVDRVRSVKLEEDSTIVVEFDCLDDCSHGIVPGFEHQPTCAVVGMTVTNAEKLLDLLNATLATTTAKQTT